MKNNTEETQLLPPKVIDILPPRDALNKETEAASPEIALLDLKDFIEKFKEFLLAQQQQEELSCNNERNGLLVKFKLNPLEVEKEPFSVLELMAEYFNKLSLKEVSDYSFAGRWLKLFMGDALKETVVKVLHSSDHPKFKLLSLPIATFSNCAPAVNFLLLPDNVSRITEKDYQLSILLACGNGCPEALKILLDLQNPSADPSYDRNASIRMAARFGNTSCVELLLKDERVSPADNHNSAIITATENGHLETLKILIMDERVDPSDSENACIFSAVDNGYLEIAKLLLKDPRVSPCEDEDACLRNASADGHLEIVRLLLADPRVDASTCDNYALESARENGHLEIVALLEEHLESLGSLS